MRITVSVEGGERVDVAISRFTEYMRDLRPFWITEFAPKWYADVQANLAGLGNRVGGWPPLSPRYAAYKARVRPGRPMMVFNGALRKSLTPSTIGGAVNNNPGAVFRPGPTSMEIGSSIKYARAHQLGLGRLPQRRIVWLAASQTYGRLLHRWAQAQSKAAGLHA